jgi:diketogulonate reductase-like aldo/keto reductase
LRQLKTDYVDLLLIHWPNKDIPIGDTLQGFKSLIDEGKIKNFGVSNFTIKHLKEAINEAKKLGIKIYANQVEFHPYLYQKELLDFCKKNDIKLTAYSPLARGEVFSDSVLKEIAKRKECSVSQIVLAWMMEKGIIVIPKASSKEHLKENSESTKIKLTKEDIKKIDSLNKNERQVHPEFAEFG